MKISAVINTYNAPRQLDLVMHGMLRQTDPPHEILFADDGSRDETRALIEAWRAKCPIPLVHVWQADIGFRRCRILNEAVRRGSGDYFIFLDGDSIPHSRWIGDHRRQAKRGRVLCGRRVRLGPQLSERLTADMVDAGELEKLFGAVFTSGIHRDSTRVLLGLRLPPALARVFHPKSRRLMGVNFSMHREALEKVNGFNEQYTTYGLEDYDLEIRLRRSGCKLYPLLNRAVVYHLHHPMKQIAAESRREFERLLSADYTRCEKGLTGPEPFDPAK